MQRTQFNDGWTLYQNDADKGAFVTLPHDAMIGTQRTPDAPSTGEQGNFAGGTYRYEKRFMVPSSWKGQRVILQFGGVYRHARVTLNGTQVAHCAYGWSPFFADLSQALLPGKENVLTVTCDNQQQPDSRWYTGAGIHRPVWLWRGDARSIEPEAVRLSTVSLDPARVQVTVQTNEKNILVELLDGECVVASAYGSSPTLTVSNAKLWSSEHPYLYTWRVTLFEVEQTLDVATGRFGIRQLSWSTDGFFVNGEPTLLRGGCIHADNGILGAAAWPDADRRRVRMLKEAGFNALRSAHNPASDATVEACDELGVYLIDETWDQWFDHKNPYDYADEWRENHLRDLDALVSRDYNHPSVVMWSIGNEVSEPRCPEGLAAIDQMVAHLHEADPTRPVTCGINLVILGSAVMGRAVYDAEKGGHGENDSSDAGLTSTTFNALSQAIGMGMNHMADLPAFDTACSPALDRLDIAGYNYARGRYRMDGRLHPGRVIVGTETLCGDVVRNYRSMQRLPYLVGDFVWSAWDYLGEAGCGAWTYGDDDRAFQKSYPWLLANQGAIDICGRPNAEMFLAQAAWGLAHNQPLVAVRPLGQGATPARAAWRFSNGIASWSWQGCDGERAVVEVFSDAPVVDLHLNGRSIGRKRPHGCICRWKVPYEPGELVATALTAQGEELGHTVLRSADPAQVRLRPETNEAKPGELVFVDVVIADDQGIVESLADRRLTAQVTDGELLAFGSARPRTEERYDNASHTTYFGHVQAIVRMGAKDLVLEVADGWLRTSVTITNTGRALP